MEAFEILTSESQERMLAIVAPERLADVRAVCEKWGLASAVIATLVPGGALSVRRAGEVVAQVPASSLADDGPEYDRPIEAEDVPETHDDPAFVPFEGDLHDALIAVLSSPNVASKRWVYEQYDSIVQGQTVAAETSDAAVVRIPGTLKGIALSSDGKGRFGHLDPYLGAMHAVAEAARNVAVTGATPLAITNCMNFGNPERPVVMWQFAESIRGMRDACLAFDTPVTGGNVSFYNESGDSAIWPTPVIGMLGLLEDYRLRVPSGFERAGLTIVLLGESFAELGGSEFADVVLGMVAGRPPALDLEREHALHVLLHEAATADLLAAAHDCGDGGLAVTLAEQAIVGGHGFAVDDPGGPATARRAVLGIGLAGGGGCGAGAPGRPRAARRRARASRSPRSERRAARASCSMRCSRRPSTTFETRTRARYPGCSARSCDRGRDVRLLGDARLRGRGHRRRGGRLDAVAPAPRLVRDPPRRRLPSRRRRDRAGVHVQLGGLPRALACERAVRPAGSHADDVRVPGDRSAAGGRRGARRRRSTRSAARRRCSSLPAPRSACVR